MLVVEIPEGSSSTFIEGIFSVAIKVERAKIKGCKETLINLPQGDFSCFYKPTRKKAKDRIRRAKARIELLKKQKRKELTKALKS